VDAPNGQLDADGLQGLLPGQNMLVNRIDESAIEVEEEGRPAFHWRRS
jgi:hypothetical protein